MFNITYTIKYVDIIKDNKDVFIFGNTDIVNKCIYIATKNGNGKKLSDVTIKTTLYHELVHVILCEGAFDNISKNEPLVEWTAKCLIQLRKNNVI